MKKEIQEYKPLAKITVRVSHDENEYHYIPLERREEFERMINTKKMVRVGDVTVRSADVLRIEENKGYVTNPAVRRNVEIRIKKFLKASNKYPKSETIKKWELAELIKIR